MSWLARLFRPQVELEPEVAARAAAWRALPLPDEAAALAETRIVVLDVETTGLDPRRDRLLAIGAVAIERGRLAAGGTFEVLLRNGAASTRENILVHGIGPEAQAGGEAPEAALLAFLEFAGKSPIAAFHAGFDRAVLDRALRETLGVRLTNAVIDIAWLAPALVPEARPALAPLDAWLARFGLSAHVRHQAAADALATGELLLILLSRARARGIATFAQLRALAEPPPGAHARRGGMAGA